MKATLTVQGADAVFNPGEGTWTVPGTVANGKLDAVRSRPSFDHKTYATTLTVTLTDRHATGTYKTPTCTYPVSLDLF